MSIQTGNIAAMLSAGRPVSLQRPKAPETGDTATSTPVRLGTKRETEPEIRAGFGENTLSPSGAALRTIDDNLTRARRLVPSVEELQAEFRARRAELEETRTEQTEAPQTETREMRAYRQTPEVPLVNKPTAQAPAQTQTTRTEAPPVQPQDTTAQTAPRPAQPPTAAAAMTANRLDLLV